jgi:hypothetical protein
MGIIATSSSVTGWRKYVQKSRFVPGERICVYAEALNVNKNGQLSLNYTFVVVNAIGGEIYRQSIPSVLNTSSTSSAAYPCFALPGNSQAGTYLARVSVYDALHGRTGQSSVQFSVTIQRGKKKATRPPKKAQ